MRRSPIHHLLDAQGASFGTKMGWERVNWFAPVGTKPVVEYGWGRQNWFAHSAAEHLAARTEVALFDQTSFAKLAVRGPDAEAALQWLCAGDVAVPPGRTVYTGLLNDRGGYEADVTVTRLFFDVTSAYAVLSVMGPRSRSLLNGLSSDDFSDSAFPFGSSRSVDLDGLTVRATRLTYVGELGWELYVPSEMAVAAFEKLTFGGDLASPRLGECFTAAAVRSVRCPDPGLSALRFWSFFVRAVRWCGRSVGAGGPLC